MKRWGVFASTYRGVDPAVYVSPAGTSLNHAWTVTDSKPFSVEFDLTPEDWTAAVAVHTADSKIYRSALRRVQLTFGGLAGLLALLMLLDGFVLGTVLTLVVTTIFLTILPPLTRRAQKKNLKAYSAEGVANGTFGPHRVTLSEYGILDATTGYEWLIKWSSVERVEDSGSSLLIYNGPNSFLPVPFTAFPDRETLNAFSERFFKHLEASDRLLEIAGGEVQDDEADTSSHPT